MRRVNLSYSLHSTIGGKPNPRNSVYVTPQQNSMDGVEPEDDLVRPPASSSSDDELGGSQSQLVVNQLGIDSKPRPTKRRKIKDTARDTKPPKVAAIPENVDDDDDPFSSFTSSQQRKAKTYSRSSTFNVPSTYKATKKVKETGVREQKQAAGDAQNPGFKIPAVWRDSDGEEKSTMAKSANKASSKPRTRGGQKKSEEKSPPTDKSQEPDGIAFIMPPTRQLQKKLGIPGPGVGSLDTTSSRNAPISRSDSGSSGLSSANSEFDEIDHTFPPDAVQDASNDFLFSQPCPVCNKTVLQSTWRLFKSTIPEHRRTEKLNTRQEVRFCNYHTQRSAKREFDRRNYPQIDWIDLPYRVRKLQRDIECIIDGTIRSRYSASLLEGHKPGKARRKRLANELEGGFGAERVGYYGGRGAQIIGEEVAKMCHEKLRSNVDHEVISAAGGIGLYIQAVMVPEVASRLVKEDMNCDLESAQNILIESADIGRQLNEELDDEVREEPESEEG